MCNTFLTNAFVHFSTADCNICEPFKNCSTCSYSIVHPSFSLGFHLVKVEPHTRCLFSVKSQQSALIGNLTVHKKFLARQSSPIDALRRFCLPRQPSSTPNQPVNQPLPPSTMLAVAVAVELLTQISRFMKLTTRSSGIC